MKYEFAAERKMIFFATAGGKKRLIEFSDRNSAGASQFQTNEAVIARAVRRTSFFKRGVIVQTAGPTEEDEKALLQQYAPKRKSIASVFQQAAAPSSKAEKRSAEPSPVAGKAENVREFPNFTMAREAVSKELGIPKSKLRNPTALSKAAADHGIAIKYTTD